MNSHNPSGIPSNYFNVNEGELNILSEIANPSINYDLPVADLPVVNDHRLTFNNNYNYPILNQTFDIQNQPCPQCNNQTPILNNQPEYSAFPVPEVPVTSNSTSPHFEQPPDFFDICPLPSSFFLDTKSVIGTINLFSNNAIENAKSSEKVTMPEVSQSSGNNCNNNNSSNIGAVSNLDSTPKFQLNTKYKFSKQLIEYLGLNDSDYRETNTIIIFFQSEEKAKQLCRHIQAHRYGSINNATVDSKNIAFTMLDTNEVVFCVVTDDNCFCLKDKTCLPSLPSKMSEPPKDALTPKLIKSLAATGRQGHLESCIKLLSPYKNENNENASQSSMAIESVASPLVTNNKKQRIELHPEPNTTTSHTTYRKHSLPRNLLELLQRTRATHLIPPTAEFQQENSADSGRTFDGGKPPGQFI